MFMVKANQSIGVNGNMKNILGTENRTDKCKAIKERKKRQRDTERDREREISLHVSIFIVCFEL